MSKLEELHTKAIEQMAEKLKTNPTCNRLFGDQVAIGTASAGLPRLTLTRGKLHGKDPQPGEPAKLVQADVRVKIEAATEEEFLTLAVAVQVAVQTLAGQNAVKSVVLLDTGKPAEEENVCQRTDVFATYIS